MIIVHARNFLSHIIDRACCIPVVIRIKNITNYPVAFQFNAINTKNVLSERSVYWEGCTIKNFNNLQPEGVLEIVLNAVVNKYGTFDLNKFLFKFYMNPITELYINPFEGIAKKIKPFLYTLTEEQVLINIYP